MHTLARVCARAHTHTLSLPLFVSPSLSLSLSFFCLANTHPRTHPYIDAGRYTYVTYNGGGVSVDIKVQGGETPQDALSLQVIFLKRALQLVKMICNLRHPVGLRHPVQRHARGGLQRRDRKAVGDVNEECDNANLNSWKQTLLKSYTPDPYRDAAEGVREDCDNANSNSEYKIPWLST